MDSPKYILSVGTKVRTHETLESTKGMMIAGFYLSNRQPNSLGAIVGVVAGHGGDVYWVTHNPIEHSKNTSEESVWRAPYCFSEFELEEECPNVWNKLQHDPLAE